MRIRNNIHDNLHHYNAKRYWTYRFLYNNVRIAPNVVVSQDIPDNATVVPAQPRVIVKDPNYHYDVKYNIWG